MRYLRLRKRAAGLLLTVAALVALTMFAVLPALASNPGDLVSPASSPGGVTPTDVGIGGNGVCSNLYSTSAYNHPMPAGVSEYDNPNPVNGTNLPSGNSDGVTFTLTNSGANSAQRLQVGGTNAQILGIAVNGGSDSTVYDYRPTTRGWVAGDGNLHAPASKFSGSGSPTQWYGISHLTVCYTPTASISGTAFTDSNGDGSQSGSTETGLSGLGVTVTNSGGTTVGTGTTGSTGTYSVPVPFGGPYTVCIHQPSSTKETVPTSSTTGGATCTATGQAQYGYTATAASGGVSGLNFGFQTVASITANAFIDNNDNGSNDSGDTAAVTSAALINSSGTVLATQTTTGGTTTFSNVPVGQTYKVCVVTPSPGSFNETVPTTSTTNQASCPSGYAAVGYSYSNLSANQTANFGFVPLKSITVNAFIDSNGNGTKDSGEGAAATGVQLFDGSGNAIGSQQTTTGGTYTFSGLAVSKTYKVCVVTPTGDSYNESVPTSGASCPSGYATVGYSYPNFTADQTANFGFVPLRSVTVNAFFDSNGNGTKDSGEGAAATGVQLFDGSGNAIGSQQTTTGGTYTFSGLPAGSTFKVCAVTPTGGNYIETVPTSSTTNQASCPTGYASVGYSFTLTTAGQTLPFGFQPVGSLSGTVYQDDNGPKGAGADGTFESTLDTPLALWTVTLYDQSGHGVGLPATTDGNGSYSIAAVFDPSQTYTVCATPPSGTGPLGQSEPLPTSADNCTSLDPTALQKGQQFTPSSAAASVTENFGVDPAVAEPEPCPPPTPFGIDNTGTGGSELQIKLAACKPNQTFVFNSGALGDGSPFVSVWASDQTQPLVPLIEKVVFPDPIVSGAPKFQHLAYTDAFPYDPDVAQQMAFCKLDPRDPSDTTGMTLAAGFLNDSTKSQILPATDAGATTPATSCVISLRTYVDASGDTFLEAYVWSDIDGFTKGIS
jgi:SdrD B-like protein